MPRRFHVDRHQVAGSWRRRLEPSETKTANNIANPDLLRRTAVVRRPNAPSRNSKVVTASPACATPASKPTPSSRSDLNPLQSQTRCHPPLAIRGTPAAQTPLGARVAPQDQHLDVSQNTRTARFAEVSRSARLPWATGTIRSPSSPSNPPASAADQPLIAEMANCATAPRRATTRHDAPRG